MVIKTNEVSRYRTFSCRLSDRRCSKLSALNKLGLSPPTKRWQRDSTQKDSPSITTPAAVATAPAKHAVPTTLKSRLLQLHARCAESVAKSPFHQPRKPYNILVLGAKNVGKSALTVRYLTRRYIGEYMSGVDLTYTHVATSVKHQPSLVFLDTSDDVDNAGCGISDESYSWADAIVLVYDVGSAASFEHAKGVLYAVANKATRQQLYGATRCATKRLRGSFDTLAKKGKCEVKPLLLVGNKTDLTHTRRVSLTEVEGVTTRLGQCIDISATELSAAEGYEEVCASVNSLVAKLQDKKRGRSGSF